MPSRPIGHYVAIQPIKASLGGESKSGIILTGTHTVTPDVIFGKVISVGKKVEAVSAGDTVAYETQSGHPSQAQPLDAEMFGGDAGEEAYIIPCHIRTIGSSSQDMQEFIDRKTRMQPLVEILKNGGGDPEMKREVILHTREINRIMEKQSQSGRNMKAFGRRIEDPGKGRGVLAVVEGKFAI